MRHVVLLTVIITVLYISISEAHTCSRNNVSNGCSIPFNLPWFYKRKFKEACNHHDICYNCGSMYGTSRRSCDSDFYTKMRSICSRLRIGKGICRTFARQYYRAVRRFGAGRYRSPSPGWCREQWTRPCSNL